MDPRCVKASPPKVRSKEFFVLTDFYQILSSLCDEISSHESLLKKIQMIYVTCNIFKLLDINVGVRRGHGGHVDSIEHNGNHIEVEHLPELLRDVVLAQGVLEGEVELKQVP